MNAFLSALLLSLMLIQSTCIAGDSSSIRTSDPFVLAVEIKSIFKDKDFK